MTTKQTNSIKVVLALFGGVVLAGLSRPAYAQTPITFPSPWPGSYQNSCSGVGMPNSFTLVANCQDVSRNLHSTSLDLRTCAAGSDVSNNNGQLQCTPLTGVPSGSYLQSCLDASVSVDSMGGHDLAAYCQQAAGGFIASQLNVNGCVGDIGNNNGNLQCSMN